MAEFGISGVIMHWSRGRGSQSLAGMLMTMLMIVLMIMLASQAGFASDHSVPDLAPSG